MGTGILGCFPKDNEPLKQEIATRGAVLSQFWPDQPPGRATFPMRNVLISGISHATVVVEASETSGASLQARIAKDQGRALFVLRSLAESQAWAAKLVKDGAAEILSDARQAVEAATTAHAGTPAEIEQLSLGT